MVGRWAAVGALALVGLLYVRPLHAYLQTRRSVEERRAEVRTLEEQKRSLEHRVAVAGTVPVLERQARRLGYVLPGEHLYIVKGIAGWRHRLRVTLGDGG